MACGGPADCPAALEIVQVLKVEPQVGPHVGPQVVLETAPAMSEHTAKTMDLLVQHVVHADAQTRNQLTMTVRESDLARYGFFKDVSVLEGLLGVPDGHIVSLVRESRHNFIISFKTDGHHDRAMSYMHRAGWTGRRVVESRNKLLRHSGRPVLDELLCKGWLASLQYNGDIKVGWETSDPSVVDFCWLNPPYKNKHIFADTKHPITGSGLKVYQGKREDFLPKPVALGIGPALLDVLPSSPVVSREGSPNPRAHKIRNVAPLSPAKGMSVLVFVH